MFKYIFSFILFCMITLFPLTAQKYTISGYITDDQTGESLIGANVFVKNPIRGTTTNNYGFYTITLEKGDQLLFVSFLSYENYSRELILDRNMTINIRLKPSAITTKEVIVTADRPDKNVQSTEIGAFEMPVEMVKKLPAIFGEVDVLKTLQLKPGIQSGGEGTTGIFVRGGSPDQNLILLDEAVVYNAAHLFGFFSVFNADALQNIEINKGNMPANYGGRLASVLDISMKEGNNKKYSAQGGIGLISSRLTFEGPIKKDTASFIISGRRTYVDLVMKPFIKDTSPLKQSSYYFYDLNAKLNYRLSDKDRVFISGYFGRDVFDLTSSQENFSNQISWGNGTAVVRWNHLFNQKLFANTSLIYSVYDFGFSAFQDQYDMKLVSGVEDWNAKLDFTWIPSTIHTVKFGGNYIYHTFTPNNVSAKTSGVELDLGEAVELYSHEGALYINDEFDLTGRLRVNAGLRYSMFYHVGPFDRYVKDPLTNLTIDTISYNKGERIRAYHHIEPRIAARFLLDELSSLKAGFTQNYQYIHLASVSAVSLPTDIWVPSSDFVKPQFGTQYSLGYFRNFAGNMFESSVEVYYKEMKNQIEYKEGALIEDNINNNTDNNFTFGTGESYGIELFVNKQIGKLTGWVGYTLSKTTRQFPEINQGEVFPAKYDRRHDVSIVTMYEINPQLNFSVVWVYATGNTATLPVSRYIIAGNIVNEYGPRNSFRMPAYHRMDVSVNWTPKQKKVRKYESNWNFSVYNLYNRRNPYYIYFETKGNILEGYMEIKARQVSLFPVLPSVTYNFKF
jgi:hypothetical protein